MLRFPDSPGLRPTPDRVRETLFNWLGQDLTGLSCLDLFAGSGALGFEAVSRGATSVVMVDHSPKVLAAMARNAEILGMGQGLKIVRSDAMTFLSSVNLRFDVLFLDPPFHDGWIDRLAPLVPGVMAADGMIYAEAESFLGGIGDWRTERHGRAGQVFYHLMRRGETDGIK
ncbi:16S rRNA (guanine(966)-N(2))-methyltransferase [Candidatus Accumulibacter phosphatis]|uniref:Ribosomal RNA small subunit methyltransferase D n=3 Tax=Betaproteobacteria incertae sedis TaxID=119066 RepID=A0A080M7M5_9PROT|nr:MAG: Ribosomal RNA small subunit methyltransferase D [Candidatus Accumulibacter cognatus]TMQ78542.1 16S rRNA (guanine(966)-N(2))-methyltransferase [Candidatus Accumulibacter phosphatis]